MGPIASRRWGSFHVPEFLLEACIFKGWWADPHLDPSLRALKSLNPDQG